MSNVETYYLIDFENVNNAGLICSRHLDYHDHIHIFSTKNAPKISIEILSNFHSVDYSFHCLPAGKQSLDMHLTAYLGYLLGTNGDKKCKYVIISKDNDYDNVITFLKEIHRSADSARHPKMDYTASAKKKNAEKQEKPGLISRRKPREKTVAAVEVPAPSEKPAIPPVMQLNTTVQHTLSRACFNNEVIAYAASLICKHHKDENAKQVVLDLLIDKYGVTEGNKVYRHVKNCLNQNGSSKYTVSFPFTLSM